MHYTHPLHLNKMSFRWLPFFHSFTFPLHALRVQTHLVGTICHLPGGKGKNVVRPYDPNESNGSWSVVLVVILPVAQIVVVVVICVLAHHFYMKYCKPLICCCFCCRRQSNPDTNDTGTSHKTTDSVAKKVVTGDADSGDACAVPMTAMGASVWHSSVNSLFMNGAAPTVAAASTHTPHSSSNGPIQITKYSLRSKADTVINCDLVELNARDALPTETVSRSCLSLGAKNDHFTPYARYSTEAGSSNQQAVSVSGNGFHYKSNPTLPQVIYRANEETCVVQCHLPPPSPPPPILSSPVLSTFSFNAYQLKEMNYPVSQSTFPRQQHQPVLARSDALPCTSRTSNGNYCDCVVINSSDELEDSRSQEISLNSNLEEEADLPEIKELFYPPNPPCVVHNPQYSESRSVSANSKSPYFTSNRKTKRTPSSR